MFLHVDSLKKSLCALLDDAKLPQKHGMQMSLNMEDYKSPLHDLEHKKSPHTLTMLIPYILMNSKCAGLIGHAWCVGGIKRIGMQMGPS